MVRYCCMACTRAVSSLVQIGLVKYSRASTSKPEILSAPLPFALSMMIGRWAVARLSHKCRQTSIPLILDIDIYRIIRSGSALLTLLNATVLELETSLAACFDFDNYERPHQSLAHRTPAENHFASTTPLLLFVPSYFSRFVILKSGSTLTSILHREQAHASISLG